MVAMHLTDDTEGLAAYILEHVKSNLLYRWLMDEEHLMESLTMSLSTYNLYQLLKIHAPLPATTEATSQRTPDPSTESVEAQLERRARHRRKSPSTSSTRRPCPRRSPSSRHCSSSKSRR